MSNQLTLLTAKEGGGEGMDGMTYTVRYERDGQWVADILIEDWRIDAGSGREMYLEGKQWNFPDDLDDDEREALDNQLLDLLEAAESYYWTAYAERVAALVKQIAAEAVAHANKERAST